MPPATLGPSQENSADVNRLFSAHLETLRTIARSRLRRDGGGFALDTTSLVNECYLRLHDVQFLQTGERAAFLSYATRAMRSIIVDLARSELAQRRGGDQHMVTLNTALADALPDESASAGGLLEVHQALEQLATVEPRLARVTELRYFGGLTLLEIAETMNLAKKTINRDLSKARLMLAAILHPTAP